jgi:hypothetical protein
MATRSFSIRALVFGILLLSLSSCSTGPTELPQIELQLEGRVLDADTNVPIEAAAVTLVLGFNLLAQGQTDANGRYTLSFRGREICSDGALSVRVIATGYILRNSGRTSAPARCMAERQVIDFQLVRDSI